ncbi:MAG TPA: ABC transporter ATP-binding protein, partial [Desulfobacterales bacterium]|nr:ABC transporter ATP-binding protein [Desulfobacterales bacterium]
MPNVQLKGIKNYICKGLDLTVRDGELLVLLGRTGAGKTTLLNVIAGLTSYEGSVEFDGIAVDNLPPRKKEVGYLFQDFCLFPHMTVSDNIGFGLKAKGLPEGDVKARINEMLATLKLQHFADRYPNKGLSGGEKQRVALARALAPSPKVLLLDEPFNSLDLRTAKHLRTELRRIQRSLHITTVYVTHNQREASEMADTVAVMHEGRIEQTGAFTEIFFDPNNRAVWELIGSPNIFSCKSFFPLAPGISRVELDGISVLVPYEGAPIEKIAISPWNIYISKGKPPRPEINQLKVMIIDVKPVSPVMEVKVRAGSECLNIELPEDEWSELDLQSGDDAYIILPLRWIEVKSPQRVANPKISVF